MKHFKTIICALFLVLIPLAYGAITSYEPEQYLSPDDSIVSPKEINETIVCTLQCHGSYVRFCDCNSLNESYNPEYCIYSVRTSESGHDTYDVLYTYREDSLRFIGNLEKCMMKGFDANDVITWANL